MDRVVHAFQVLAQPAAGTTAIRDANAFLENFQKTQQAWTVADELLAQQHDAADATANASLHAAHIFAAQTLRAKIQFDFAELPAATHEQLRATLLKHVLQFGRGPQPVLTQLCLAVASLALHMEAWAAPVTDLVAAMTAPADEALAKIPCLLALLTVLPEEAENMTVGVVPRRRDDFRAALAAAGPTVIQLLAQVHAQCQASASHMGAALRCLASWMRSSALSFELIQSSPLLGYAFSATGDPVTFDAAVDALVELVHCTRFAEAHTSQLVAAIVPPTLALVPQLDEAAGAGDEDAARMLVRLFTEVGEQYLPAILAQYPSWAVQLADGVLRGCTYSEPAIAEMTFNFWYMLAEELAGSGRALPFEQRAEVCARFGPVFLSLLRALRTLAEFPAHSESMQDDERDEQRRFRYALGDTITDACKVLSSVRCIEECFGALQERLPALAADANGAWRSVEVCIFCARQMISSSDPSFLEADVVRQLLELLTKLPASGTGMLVDTCIRTVGTYAGWLTHHPDMLPAMLTYVANGLGSQVTAAAASQALKHLCDACSEHLHSDGLAEQLLQMYNGTLAMSLNTADRVDIVTSLSFVVSQMSLERVGPAMEAVAQPLVARLQQAIDAGSSAELASLQLDQLCALLSKTSPMPEPTNPGQQDARHPSVVLLEQIWPLLEACFARYGGDTPCMERLCRIFKYTLRNVLESPFKPNTLPIVERVVPQTAGRYEQQPLSCFIYLCNSCIRSYFDVVELQPIYATAVRRITQRTFQLLSASQSAMVDNPDVVDDFFQLFSSTLARIPHIIEPEQLNTIGQCGCVGMHLQHREANRSVIVFWEQLATAAAGRGRPVAEPVRATLSTTLAAYGNPLVQGVVLGLAGKLPEERAHLLSRILRTLISVDPQLARQWIESALQSLPAGAHADSATLIAALFSSEAHNPRVFDAAIDAFAAACRRRRIEV